MKPEIQTRYTPLSWVNMADPYDRSKRIVGMRIEDTDGIDFHKPMDQLRVAYDSHADLLAALQGLFEHCAMTHKHWGEGCNQREADAAQARARAAIAKATQS